MAESGSEEKTEAPSQKKRDDARQEGQVAFSKELSSAVMLGGFLLLFYMEGSTMIDVYEESFVYTFSNINLSQLSIPLIEELVPIYGKHVLILLGPFFLTTIVLGILSSVFQVGFNITFKPLQPKFSKLSPIAGLKRVFSKQALSELIKSIFKMVIVGYIGYYTFAEYSQEIQNLVDQEPRTLLNLTGTIIGVFALRLFMAFFVLSLADFMFQKWDLEQKLKMSKQDIKEEMKQSEGDPQLKAKIRQIQQQMSQSRMMQDVPKADVIVTNPSHFAIAMKYDREVMVAPQVVAKGSGHMARRIIEVAEQNGVTIYQSAPIARGLYFQVEIGQGVPEEFYRAVAEILAIVYKARRKKGGKSGKK